MTDGVSVIVCCYNSAQRISDTLRYLSRQMTSASLPWEIILVDNASTDATKKKATEIWEETGAIVPLRIIDEPKPGLSYARNAGILKSAYEFVLFCDDDNWLTENYVQLVYDILTTNQQIGVLGGRNVAITDGGLPYWFNSFEEFYAVGCQALDSGELRNRDFVFGAGMAFRNSVYRRLLDLGFKNLATDRTGTSLISGGDVELCYVMKITGYKIWYDERLSLYHYMTPNRLTKEYLRALQQGANTSVDTLQVYDPYLQGLHKKGYKKVVFFLFYAVKYAAAKIMNRGNAAYFSTYLEACSDLPLTISRPSAGVKALLKKASHK